MRNSSSLCACAEKRLARTPLARWERAERFLLLNDALNDDDDDDDDETDASEFPVDVAWKEEVDNIFMLSLACGASFSAVFEIKKEKKKECLRFLVFNKTNAEEEMFSKNHSKVIYYQ